MKRLIFIPLLILSVLCNAQFTKGGGTFLKTGSGFMTASTVPAEPAAYELLSGTTEGNQSSNVSSHPITMPTGTSAGDLIVVCVAWSDSRTMTINTGVSGNNWTIEDNNNPPVGASYGSAILWKIAEGSDALTLTTSANTTSAFIAYRIGGAYTTNPMTVTKIVDQASTNANPPSNTPEYGSYEYIWIVFAQIGEDTEASAAPTDFSGLLTNTSGGVSVNTATRLYTTDAAYNPGAFTSTIRWWTAYTVIINPVQ